MEEHRQRGFLVFIICFLRSSQVSHSSGLTIDNQLVIIANDCYTRVAIGFKLPDMDIFSSVAVGSISECEDECSKRRNSCNAFAFGVGIKGNGTCALSREIPKPEELQTHADYDVYVRSQRSLHCEPDRLYEMRSGGIGRERGNETKSTMIFGSGLSDPTVPSILSSSRIVGSTMHSVANDPSYQQGYVRSLDDERRISDILGNRNPMPPASGPFGNVDIDNDLSMYPNRKSAFGQRIHFDSNYDRPEFGRPFFRNSLADINYLNFESNSDNDLRSYKPHAIHNGLLKVFSRPVFVHDEASKSKSTADLKFWIDRVPTKDRGTFTNRQHQSQGFFNNVHKNHGTITRLNELVAGSYDIDKISRPTLANSYNLGIDGAKISTARFEDTSDIRNPGSLIFRGFGTTIIDKSCYRRLLSGKKSLELYVRRAVKCENIEDCHRACDYEKFFICEGFNYRRMGHGTRGMCEMTSVPNSRMDFHRDFVSDPQCDYYEKDPNCVRNAPGTRPSYWNQPSTPSQSYGPPSGPPNERPDTRPYAPDRYPLEEAPRPLDYDRRPSNEIPRPFDYGDHRRPPIIYGHPHHGQYDDTFDRRSYVNNQGHTEYSGTRWEDSIGYGGRLPSRRPAHRKPSWTRYPNRRIDHGPPRDIGTNEIGPYLPDYRKDPTRDWGTYGSSYGYDTNYAGKLDVSKYHPKPPQPKPPPPPPPHPYENDHFYGDFYNYGGAFGYGDNYIPADQDPLYGGTGKTEECSVRAGAGFKLSKAVIRKTYLTSNLDQCEGLCLNEKSYICMSFSYRYNVAATDPTDNCLLSDVSYKDLNFYIDLEPDRDYDIYATIVNSRTCGTRREPSPHPPDECFWRVRSGFGMPADVVRKSIIVNNLGECQVACTLAQDFTCRSFAFKYGLEQDRSDIPINCYLSDWPSQDINPVHMPDMDGAELYEKGSFGRGCEPYAVPFFNIKQFNGKQSPQVCYSGYTKPCKLTPYAVLLATYVNSEQDCRQKCSRMRETDSIPCMSYSYKLTTHGTEENCLLSDVPIRDLRLGLDYIYDNNHVLYAWKDLDPYCAITGYSIDNDHVFGGQSPLRPLLPGPTRPDFTQEAGYPNVRPDDTYPDPRPYFKPGSYHHGERPFDPDKPDPVKPPHRPGDGYSDKFDFGVRPGILGSLYPNEFSTFRRYTVNGYPCKKGTKCEKNKIAGFWTCEPEGSEYGNWDYCCAPTHHCGFSQGYQYPWCYVGSSEDQWRPCSEKYHPYLPSPRPIRPMIGSDERHDRPDYRYDPGYGRYWPITYLHGESPPNCTDSLASADNSEGRRSNETIPMTIVTSSSTVRGDENGNGNGNANRTRRRRLRVRTIANNRQEISSRKIDDRILANEATQNRVNLTSRERGAKFARVSKPTTTSTATPLVAANASEGAQFENTKINNGMIRVPLVTTNKSLPAMGA